MLRNVNRLFHPHFSYIINTDHRDYDRDARLRLDKSYPSQATAIQNRLRCDLNEWRFYAERKRILASWTIRASPGRRSRSKGRGGLVQFMAI